MTREIAYKIKILRNNASVSTLEWDADDAPSVDMDSEAEIKSSLQGTFLINPDYDPLKDELQPVIVTDGQETPLGVYACATPSYSGEGSSRRMTIEAYDRCWKVQSTRTEAVLHFSAGTKYMAAIDQLLTGAGISLIMRTDSEAVFPADREDWDIGTDYLTIINDLLKEMNYNPLWFDAGGYAHIEPYTPPSSAVIKRNYSARDIRRLPMLPGCEEETDIFSAPNVFICICSNADRTASLVAISVNDSPMSSKSVFRRGRRIVEVVKVDQIADQAALQAYADRLRTDSMMATQAVTFYVPAEGGHGMQDVISIDHPDVGGIYMELGWSLTMAQGESMAITARRTVMA